MVLLHKIIVGQWRVAGRDVMVNVCLKLSVSKVGRGNLKCYYPSSLGANILCIGTFLGVL